jgi:hypothetical protein
MMFSSDDKEDKHLSNMYLVDGSHPMDAVVVSCEESFENSRDCDLTMDITVSNDSPDALTAAVEEAGSLVVATYALMTEDEDGGWQTIVDGTLTLDQLVTDGGLVSQRIDLESQRIQHGWTQLVITKEPIDALPTMIFTVFVDL